MYMDINPRFVYVGTASNEHDCLTILKENDVDLVLLDIQIKSERDGIEMIPKIKGINPAAKIVMLTSHNDDNNIFLSMAKGAFGYVVKKPECQQMFEEIERIYDGLETGTSDGREVMDIFRERAEKIYENHNSMLFMIDNLVKLSMSEYEILKEIYNGNTYKQIAEKRIVEEVTIKTTALRIIRKFNIGSMKELIANLRELNIFEQL